jgi:diguanylate cyclase (GGDEF)-like protein
MTKMPVELADQQGNPLDRAILKANRELLKAGPVFWVTFYGIALILTIALGTTLIISSVRDREITRSENELNNTVRILAAQFDRHIETFESIPKSVANYLTARVRTSQEFKEFAASENLHRLLQEKSSESIDFAGVNIFDSDGNFVNSSERWPVPPINLSDRQFFQAFKAGTNGSPVLIQLIDSRVSKGQTIVVARKISSTNGSFLGMITRSISPSVFEALFSASLTPEGFLALVHRDGSLLARYPHAKDAIGKALPEASLIEQMSTDDSATTQLVSPVDNEERLVSAKSLEHYPVYVVASETSSAALASWRQETRTFASGAGLAALIVAIMLLAIVKYLREQHRRLDIAVNNLTQGLLLYDSDARIVLCNKRYLEIYNLSPDVVKPGLPFRDLIEYRKQTGSFQGDVDKFCTVVLNNVAKKQTTHSVVETANGRSVAIVNQPLANGGWVTTQEDITERKRAEKQIAHLAHYDALTDLPNRVMFRKQLEDQIERAKRGEQLAVLYIDVDAFKSVNDTLGHPTGDELLRAIAVRLRSCVRDTDCVARLGGDEFAIVQAGVGRPNDVMELVKRIYEAIRKPVDCLGHLVTTDVSIGIALAPNDGTTVDQILRSADLAMYGAKEDGRRTYRFFEPEMDARVKARRAIELDVRHAIADGSFELHYQPVVNLLSNEIVGCEALLRWNHPVRGMISPAEFIPIAEETGLICELGDWVLATACTEAATWPSAVKVAVNVSPVQFRSHAFSLKVANILATTGLSAHRLELEITEAVLIRDDEGALAMLQHLRALGVRIALDDFGTGYSSLSYLRRFPFDKIKIDRSFVSDVAMVDGSSSIVQAVIDIARARSMTTTAEGVETEGQRDVLVDLGCTEMQGYLISRARPAAEIRPLLEPAKMAALALTGQ